MDYEGPELMMDNALRQTTHGTECEIANAGRGTDMLLNVPANSITEEAVKNVLEANTDAEMTASLSPATICSMCKVLCDRDVSTPEEALAMMRGLDVVTAGNTSNETDEYDVLCTVSIMDDIAVRVVDKEGTATLEILDDGKIVGSVILGTIEEEDEYDAEDVGSGRANNGTYYLSISVFKSDEEHREISMLYKDGLCQWDRDSDWTTSETNDYNVFSDEKQYFVSFSQRQ